jgi:hypothetical protein
MIVPSSLIKASTQSSTLLLKDGKISPEASNSCAAVVVAPFAHRGVQSSATSPDSNGDAITQDNNKEVSPGLSTPTSASSITYPPQSEAWNNEDTSQSTKESDATNRLSTVPSVFVCGPSELKIFGRPTLPSAFHPNYANDRAQAIVKLSKEAELSAYARSSMSSWFRNPANSTVRGIPAGLPPAGTALSHVSGGRYNRPSRASSRGRTTAHNACELQNHSSTAKEKKQEAADKVLTAPLVATTTITTPEPTNGAEDTL